MFTVAALAAGLAVGVTMGSPLTVMSYNIRYGTAPDGPDAWIHRRPRLMQVLRNHPADVVGLQEALAPQIEEILAEFPALRTLGVGRDDGEQAGEFSAILFRTGRLFPRQQGTFWLSDTPETVASKSWGNRITRICTWAKFEDSVSRRMIWVFNTHLDHESQPAREKGVELILRRIAAMTGGDPVIITGDFNAGESNPAVNRLRKAGFRDTWRVANPTAPEPGTFSGFRPELGKDKIDYVWVDASWRVVSARLVMDKVDDRWPSDHLPVMAELALVEE